MTAHRDLTRRAIAAEPREFSGHSFKSWSASFSRKFRAGLEGIAVLKSPKACLTWSVDLFKRILCRTLRILAFWFHLFVDVVREFIEDDCSFLAAGIAFYAFLSLFPLGLLSVTILGYLLSLPWLHDQIVLAFSQLDQVGDRAVTPDGLTYTLRLIHSFFPTQSHWLESELQVLAQNWGRNVLVSLLVGLWSGRHLFMVMEFSLHRTWDMPIRRHLVTRSLMSMGLILVTGAVTLALLLFSVFTTLVEQVLSRFPLPTFLGLSLDQAMIWGWVTSWVLVPLGVGSIFLMLYRLLPSEPVPFAYALPGAIFSGLAWRLASSLYILYGLYFGRISAVYGSIWYIVGLMMWLYIVAFVFLAGAEIVYVYAHRRTTREIPCDLAPEPVD
jgi:membrane protein